MPLVFYCTRRHLLAVDASVAGKRVMCPVCKELMIAPASSMPASEPVASEPASAPPPPDLAAAPPPAPIVPDPSTAIGAGTPPLPMMEIPAPQPAPMVLPVAEDPPAVPMATVAPPLEPAPEPFQEIIPLGPVQSRRRESVPTDGDEDPQDRVRGRLTKRQQLDRLNLGLALHYWKYLAVLVGNLLIMAGVLLFTVPFLILVGIITLFLGFLVNFAAPVLGISGSILCSTAPERIGGRPFIFASLGFDTLAVLFTCSGAIVAVVVHNLIHANIFSGLSYLAVLANIAGFVLFMLFLRLLALSFGDDTTAHEILTIVVTLAVTIIGGPVITLMVSLLVGWLLGPEGAVVMAGLGAISIVSIYLNLLFRVLAVISTLRARIG